MNKSSFFIVGKHAVVEALKNPKRKVLKIFPKAEKKLLVIKNGDHSLSSPKCLKILEKELKKIIN